MMESQFYKQNGPCFYNEKSQYTEHHSILQTLQNMWTAIKIILCVAPVLGLFNLPYPDCMIQASHPSLFPALSHPLSRHYLCFFHTGKTLPSFLLISVNLSHYPSIHPSSHPCGTSRHACTETKQSTLSITCHVYFMSLSCLSNHLRAYSTVDMPHGITFCSTLHFRLNGVM